MSLIIVNGGVAFATADGGFDDPRPCNIQQTAQSLQDSTEGETYVRTAYTVLIDRDDDITEYVRLFNDRGRDLGTFAVKSAETLSLLNLTRICL